jgi:hypothetical protein
MAEDLTSADFGRSLKPHATRSSFQLTANATDGFDLIIFEWPLSRPSYFSEHQIVSDYRKQNSHPMGRLALFFYGPIFAAHPV